VIDYYLKFADEAEAKLVLYTKNRPVGYEYVDQEVDVFVYATSQGEYTTIDEYTPEECDLYGYTFLRKGKETQQIDPNPEGGEWTYKANYKNIDVLGVLYEKQDIVDPENPPEPIPLEGWHVNVRVMPDENGEPLEAFKVNPEPMTWRRIWG
jgi:hypothetical protein